MFYAVDRVLVLRGREGSTLVRMFYAGEKVLRWREGSTLVRRFYAGENVLRW